MTIDEFAELIKIPAATIKAMHPIPFSKEESEKGKNLFTSDWEKFDQEARSSENGLAILKLYLKLGIEAKAEYDRLGIPDKVYWDSFQDIKIWCEDFTTKTGLPGFHEWGWIRKTINLELFRLGRLQFEPVVLESDWGFQNQTFPAGSFYLNVHIPAGEPLDPDKIAASFEQAPVFFQKYLHINPMFYVCHSWLLAPKLREILPKNSRILQFQNQFSIIRTDNGRQAEGRVFGYITADPSGYPEKTSLQKDLKKYLMSGKKVGMGAGIRLI